MQSRRCYLFLVLVLLLPACLPVPLGQRSCDQLSAAEVRPLFTETISVEQFRAWVAETYDLSVGEVHATNSTNYPNYWVVDWKKSGGDQLSAEVNTWYAENKGKM